MEIPILKRRPGNHWIIEPGAWKIVARAKVDPEDYEQVSRELWRMGRDGKPYTTIDGRVILMQRYVWMLNHLSEDVMVYTRNQDPLDCRRSNLYGLAIKPLKPVMA